MRAWAVSALAVLAMTACGSTVQVPAGTTPESLAGSGPIAPTDESLTGGGLNVPAAQTSTTGATGTGGAAGPGGADGPAAPDDPADPQGTAPPPGAPSTKPVRVGVLYLQDASAGANAIGIQGLATGDAQAQAKAVINWINDNGGGAGRKLEPYFAGYTVTEAQQNLQQAQETACVKLTQDDDVQFVVSYLYLLPGTLHCFAKAGVSVIDDLSGLADDVQRENAAHFAAPGDIAPGRILHNLVDALWRSGWLTAESKVGSYAFDTPEMKHLVETDLAQALAAHGLKTAEAAYVSGTAQNSGVSLRFRSEGIDRIIPVQANPLFLMQAATSQQYYPKYALYSTFGPGALMEVAAPHDQLAGSAGIGWSPYLDIGSGEHPPPVNGNESLCFEIYQKSDQASSSATTKGLQLNLCSALLYLKFAADGVGSVPDDLLVRARSIGGRAFPPPDTFRSDMRQRTDGAAAYRELAYLQACRCFQYVSPIHATIG